MPRQTAVVLTLLLLFGLSLPVGCRMDNRDNQGGKTILLTIYFPDKNAVERGIQGATGFVRSVERELPRTTDVLRFAMEELIRGPQDGEGNLTPVIPTATKVRDASIVKGTAIIDFSADLINSPDSPRGTFQSELFLQAVVFTATELSTVKNVLIRVEGEPYSDGHNYYDYPLNRDSFCRK